MTQTRLALRTLAASFLIAPALALAPAPALAQGTSPQGTYPQGAYPQGNYPQSSYAQGQAPMQQPGQPPDGAFTAPPGVPTGQQGSGAPDGQGGPGQGGPGPGGPGQGPQMTQAQQAQAMQAGADQVVGLYMATCIRYPGDPAGLRGWVTGRGAPPMPRQAADMFLTGRTGQVYDVSYQDTRLALISLDDGGCEAVSEFADPQDVVNYLGTAFQQSGISAKVLGDFGDPKRPGVHQRVWQTSIGGRQWVLNAVTAAQVPQASLGLHPFVAAQR